MKQKHAKYIQINTNKSIHSDLGPVWQNSILRRPIVIRVLSTVHKGLHMQYYKLVSMCSGLWFVPPWLTHRHTDTWDSFWLVVLLTQLAS